MSQNETLIDLIIAISKVKIKELERFDEVSMLYAIQQGCEAIAQRATKRIETLSHGGLSGRDTTEMLSMRTNVSGSELLL
ncbi:MAG: hypothetical protein EOL88_12010 [Bacteroidia bacterium]|nr:hypothetical protein [Bacteroidia bacterium]